MATADEKRIAARKWVVKAFQELKTTANMNKDDIEAAADATIDKLNDLKSDLNTALPEPFKSTATLAQKSLMVAYSAMKIGNII